jgi:hypothetical protein
MQASTLPAPQTGAATSSPGTFTSVGPNAGMTLRQLRALRDELSSQLSNVNSRRNDIAGELRKSLPGADRAGIEGRLAVLDARIAQMETDLATTGRLVQQAEGNSVTAAPPPARGPWGTNGPDPDQLTAISIIFTLAVLMPLSIAWGRAIFRRASKQAEQPSKQLMARLDRMEEGIEAIAIEVERISEGQRFVTKVIGAGAADPVAVPQRDRVELQR